MLYAYGEDAMTLYALTERQEDLLETLPDYKADDNYLFFYRPSFGRGGPAAQGFGEFDAIIASKSRIYLIESKWQRENTTKKKIELAAPQVFRHVIFEWIFKEWNAWKDDKEEEKWCSFRDAKNKKYGEYLKTKLKSYHEKPLPKGGKLLTENLQYVLNRLRTHFKNENPDTETIPITNVLLLFYEKKVVHSWDDETLDELSVAQKEEKPDKNKIKDFPEFKVVPFKLEKTMFVEVQKNKEKKPKIFKLNLSKRKRKKRK